MKRRGLDVDFQPLQIKSKELRDLEELRSTLQSKGNQIGKEVGQKIKSGLAPQSDEIKLLRSEGNEIKQKVTLLEAQEKQISEDLKTQILNLPNIPSKLCPEGKDEKDNQEVRRWGTPRTEGNLKEHWEIAFSLNLLDSERSTRIAKSRFITLFNQGARLERALINFMIDMHYKKGYKEVLPPFLVNSSSLTGSGQLPKFAEESFKCAEDDLWLTPTAEVPVTALHRDEIIAFDQLPLKYVAYSPCFRREAGSYGKDTKGLIRLHQFNKVELYWFSHPEQSKEAHKQLIKDAESVL